MYIKLESDMSLVITVQTPIYRGDNLNQNVIYLIPKTIEEIDTLTACLYLCAIRADGVADVYTLERMDDLYNDDYYQYTIPLTCKLTRYAGEVCTWLAVYAGTATNPQIAKSGECVLHVQDSKNLDDYLCDHQLTALYQIQSSLNADVEAMQTALAGKADSLRYDTDTRQLQLEADGEAVGEAVTVPSDSYLDEAKDAVEDTWSDMTDTTEDAGDAEWEGM